MLRLFLGALASQHAHLIGLHREHLGHADTELLGLDPSVPASSDPELWQVVAEASPTRNNKEWNWAVLDLAASVCLPKVPRCLECPLQAHCRWSQAHG